MLFNVARRKGLGAPPRTTLRMSQSKSRSGKTAPAAGPGAPGKRDSSPKAQKAGFVSKIPPVLFEGDQPAPSPVPIQKYTVAPGCSAVSSPAEPKLPEAYGTEKLGAIARDPHCLYVFWDVTRDQQQRYFEGSGQRELLLRIHEQPGGERPVSELRTDLQSRSWFLAVPRGGVNYRASLGFDQPGRGWVTVAASDIVRTPSADVSAERQVRFAGVIASPSITRLQKPGSHLEPIPRTPRGSGIDDFGVSMGQWEAAPPEQAELDLGLPPPETWSPAREQALQKIINIEAIRHEWFGSLEIAQLIAGQHLESEIVSLAGPFGSPMRSEQLGGISSFGALPSGPRQFWFNLNAELVVYGATEPNARVTLGGREIKLRPDGTFSYRFAFPDGSFELPAAATSADNETRAAILRFIRQSEYHAEIGASPQDPSLNAP